MKRIDWRSLIRLQGGCVLMILCGTILTIWPDSASVLVSTVLGWLVIAFGAMLVITGVIGGMEVVTLIQGACLLAAGAWLHRHPLMIASILGIVLGLLVLGQGWRKAKRVRYSRAHGGFWVWDAGLAALELLVGLMLIFVPLSLSRLIVRFAGIFLVLCGVIDLLSGWKDKDNSGGFSGIIDADR